MDLGASLLSSSDFQSEPSSRRERKKSGYRNTQWDVELPVYDTQPRSLSREGIMGSTSRFEPSDILKVDKWTLLLFFIFLIAVIVLGYLLMEVSSLRAAFTMMMKKEKE